MMPGVSLKILLSFSMLLSANIVFGQSMWFGVKGGAAMNFQRWSDGSFSSSSNSSPLFSLNGDLFVESYDEEKKGSLYAQLGFHTRGSAFRFFSFNNTFTDVQGFKFRNIVLELGAKKPMNLGKEFDPYFILGVRGEYTVGTNLDDYLSFGSLFYPVNDFVRKWLAGVTIGGGFETRLSDLSNVFVEISLQPDFTNQYFQPPLFNIIDPWTLQTININQREERNLSFEVKVGARFLRKVEYID